MTDPTAPPRPAPPVDEVGGRHPVTLGSRFVHAGDLPYTEVGGHPVVVVPRRRRAYELTPAALALWAALDGRPVAEVLAAIGAEARAHDHVDLLRRWRALGLVEEQAVLERFAADPDRPEAAPRGHEAEPTSGSELHWRPPDPTAVTPPDGDDPLEWFSALLRWVADDDLDQPGLADALAEVAEQPSRRAEVAARLCDPQG